LCKHIPKQPLLLVVVSTASLLIQALAIRILILTLPPSARGSATVDPGFRACWEVWSAGQRTLIKAVVKQVCLI